METAMDIVAPSRRRPREVFSDGGLADASPRPSKRACHATTPPSPLVLFVKFRSRRILLVDRQRLLELSQASGSQRLHFSSFYHARQALSPNQKPKKRTGKHHMAAVSKKPPSTGDEGHNNQKKASKPDEKVSWRPNRHKQPTAMGTGDSKLHRRRRPKDYMNNKWAKSNAMTSIQVRKKKFLLVEKGEKTSSNPSPDSPSAFHFNSGCKAGFSGRLYPRRAKKQLSRRPPPEQKKANKRRRPPETATERHSSELSNRHADPATSTTACTDAGAHPRSEATSPPPTPPPSSQSAQLVGYVDYCKRRAILPARATGSGPARAFRTLAQYIYGL